MVQWKLLKTGFGKRTKPCLYRSEFTINVGNINSDYLVQIRIIWQLVNIPIIFSPVLKE
jgi:hypothetical protein